MTIVKLICSTLISCSCWAFAQAQDITKVTPSDLNLLIGNWKGALTYLDYSSGKPYTMPANVEINRIGNTNQYVLFNIYPDEMQANGRDTLTLSTDGMMIGSETLKAKNKLADGTLEIVTEELGKDGNDNKPAIFRHTYTISTTGFKKRKDVQFVGTTVWINRHEYAYSRNPASK